MSSDLPLDEVADRLYTQALTDPQVNSLRKVQMAHYIRQEADKLCLDPYDVLDHLPRLEPYTLDVIQASDLR